MLRRLDLQGCTHHDRQTDRPTDFHTTTTSAMETVATPKPGRTELSSTDDDDDRQVLSAVRKVLLHLETCHDNGGVGSSVGAKSNYDEEKEDVIDEENEEELVPVVVPSTAFATTEDRDEISRTGYNEDASKGALLVRPQDLGLREKPMITKLAGPSGLLARVQQFLPQLQQANIELEERIRSEGAESVAFEVAGTPTGSGKNVDQQTGGDDTAGVFPSENDDMPSPLIHMDLALGVFEKDQDCERVKRERHRHAGVGLTSDDPSSSDSAKVVIDQRTVEERTAARLGLFRPAEQERTLKKPRKLMEEVP